MSNILKWILCFVFVLLIGMAINSHTQTNTNSTKDKTYVYLDVDKIISSITKEVTTSRASKEELDVKVIEMKQRFETILTDYQKTHNAIIFSSPKPIKGADDKTEYFIEQMRIPNVSEVSK